MFFMVTYGTLNLACFYEGYSHNPSFRPRFRYSHWSLSLAGAVGCAAVMLLMAPLWAACSALAMWGLHRYIARSNPGSRWGDVQSGMAFEQTRGALLRLEQEVYHPKNWRPTILALSGSVWNRYHLAEYGYWLAAGRGLLTFAHVTSGAVENRPQLRERHERRLRQFIQEHELKAFAAVVAEEDLLAGTKALLQCYGIGAVRPNTVLLGWSDDLQRLEQTAHLLRLVRDFKRSLVIVKCAEGREPWTARREPSMSGGTHCATARRCCCLRTCCSRTPNFAAARSGCCTSSRTNPAAGAIFFRPLPAGRRASRHGDSRLRRRRRGPRGLARRSSAAA
jgi:hypothetical protein